MSELDLSGLSAFLGRHDVGLDCDWQLQFHFGVFRGREPDYAAQEAAASAMRAQLRAEPWGNPAGSDCILLHDEQLTAQYQRLGVAAFGTLPYPVHELFRPRPPAVAGRTAPHRLPRPQPTREGLRQLPLILRSLWTDWLAPGRAQLVLQTRHRGLRRDARRL